MATEPLKISYCTTCRGRLHHLRETLPANMAAEKDNPNVEFVVLDYGSEDGLGEWIKENFQKEMESGRLRYARYEAPHFEMGHAKNMAHRVATGDVVCNVDADNFIAPDFSRWLNKQFDNDRHGLVSCQTTSVAQHVDRKLNGVLPWRERHPIRGVGGRIALRRDDFERLGGYDEKYTAWGEEDVNLVIRGRELGLEMIKLPHEVWGRTIAHGHDERISQLSDADKAVSVERLERPKLKRTYYEWQRILQRPDPVANATGNVGCGPVHINFAADETQIGSLANRRAVPEIAPLPSTEPLLRTDWAEKHGPQAHPQNGPRGR